MDSRKLKSLSDQEWHLQEWEYLGHSVQHGSLLLELCYPRADIKYVGNVRVIFSEKFRLGEGSNETRVYLGLTNDGYGKAVKQMRRDNYFQPAQHEKKILNEFNAIKSKYVVNYYFLEENTGTEYVYLILDLCEESLKKFVKDSTIHYLQKALPDILRQILNGLADLHRGPNPILHRDLKPSNVLRDVDGKFLIADFGISRMLKNGSKTHRSKFNMGTEYWIAPESYCEDEDSNEARNEDLNKARYKKESDVYNAGMVAYYVATKGKHPFGTERLRLDNMLSGKPVGLDDIKDETLKDLLSWMLKLQPEERPSANEALKHPFLLSDDEIFHFLCKVGDLLSIERNDPQSIIVEQLNVESSNWKSQMDNDVYEYLVNGRKYGSSWKECLRLIQDIGIHWNDRPRPLPQPEPFYKIGDYRAYFVKTFPSLPVRIHAVLRSNNELKENVWTRKLWLEMLKEDSITTMTYESFVSLVSGTLRERATVLNSGVGHRFEVKFPFSWIIKDIVQDLLLKVGGDITKRLELLRSIFDASPLGILNKLAFEDTDAKEEAVKSYLIDFLHMMYKPVVKNELKLIHDAVLATSWQIHQTFHENDEFQLDIPLIHFAYSMIQERLLNFSELVHAFPQLVEKLMESPPRINDTEMCLDALALHCCLEELQPNLNDFKNLYKRKTWCNQVQCLHSIIQDMKTSITESGKSNNVATRLSKESSQILEGCWIMFTRLDVVRMFIEHTCPPEELNHTDDGSNAFKLWKELGESPVFTSLHTIEVIDKFLKDCSEKLQKREMKVSLETWKSFRNRCKSFFMNVVSDYCFGDDLPQDELVQKFMSYVIKDENGTEDFTPFNGHRIDVTPVIRSYILQQLLAIKERESKVCEYLEKYLCRAQGLSTNKKHLVNVCVLFVHCIEDVEIGKLSVAKQTESSVEIHMLNDILLKTQSSFCNGETLDIKKLKDIASIRAAFNELSTFINDNFPKVFRSHPKLKKCIQVAKHLCENRSFLQFFLLKQLLLNDSSGLDGVKERCKNKKLKWILPPQLKENDRSRDNFLVHGDNYHTVREAMIKLIIASNSEEMQLTLRNMTCDAQNQFCYILLAFYGEVKTKFPSGNEEDRISFEMVKKLGECVTEYKLPLAKNLLENFKESPYKQLLHLQPEEENANVRRLNDILIHFLVVMSCFPNNQLLGPFSNLAFNPRSMRNAFIPTMPHDDGPEVIDVGDSTSYESINGQRYGEEPDETYNSLKRGVAIGEENSRKVQNSTGHILGRAYDQLPTAQRNLNSLSCCVLRCLVHLAMLLGTSDQSEDISAIIKPPVDDIVQFIRDHIQNDLCSIARFVGTNVDEATLIIHLIFVEIVKNNHGNIDFSQTDLHSKESRQAWEDTFMNTYLNPVLSVVSELLKDALSKIVSDERLENNEVMKQIYEIDEPSSHVVTNLDPSCPALWRNRKKMTIGYLSFKYEEYSQGVTVPADKCEVLDEFLKKECHLRALQYLPEIIKLQRLLFEKFHLRLDRNEAEKYTIKHLYKEDPDTKKHFTYLIDNFRKAWKIIKSSLVQSGLYGISKELSEKEVTNATPISMLLPSWRGLGKCSLALTNYLVSLHNNFIGRCKSLLKEEKNLEELPLSNVTKGHLVAYDPERDLLPMVLAHCDYSLKVGEETEETEETVVNFNWKSLERQLVDRFIREKPRITSSVQLFVFSKDICDGAVFKALSKKIPQVTLSRQVRHQILSELNQLPEICDVLKYLHIVIGFLSSAGGNPGMLISDYMKSALKLDPENALKSGKAEQFCQLQHVVALWKLLSLERARILTKNNQDPFDDVTDKIKTALNEKLKFKFSQGLQKINIDRFVDELLKLILLFLKNATDEKLHLPLAEYINRKLEQDGCTIIEDLRESLPDGVTVAHAVHAWKLACEKTEEYYSNDF